MIDHDLSTVTYSCSRCGQPVEVLEQLRRLISNAICPQCAESVRKAQSALNRSNRIQEAWAVLCPPEFQKTVLERLPKQERSNEALNYPLTDRGLNLWGMPDTGKTRTSWLILQREHYKGRKVMALSPGDFDAYYEAAQRKAEWIRMLSRLDVILFDDIDKYGMNYQAEKAFFALIDARNRYNKPNLFTGNSNGEKLSLKFREGEAMVRRIRQFAKSIHFK